MNWSFKVFQPHLSNSFDLLDKCESITLKLFETARSLVFIY